jgi:hypothetical protein
MSNERYLLRSIRISLLLAVLIFIVDGVGQGTAGAGGASPAQAQQSQPAQTAASAVDREIDAIEKRVLEAAEAMPEERFYFSPASLKIPGGAYLGARTFASEVKHIGASNYILWSAITGDKVPEDLFNGGNGPKALKTKAEIIQFMKDSFALGHRAAATLTFENMLQPAGNGRSSRLNRVIFGVTHAYDHYGQMVEYLRMNGIVPPATRHPE